jgi:hypothetical protein
MDRLFTPSLAPFWIRSAVLGIAIVFGLFVWLVAVWPAAIDFTVAVAAAVAWCIWLDRERQH